MAFQPVPNVASFRIRHIGGGGQDLINTIYVRNVALGWPTARLSSTATTIGNAWRDQVMPLIHTAVVFDRVDARDEGSEFGSQATVEYNTGGGLAGDGTSYALAAFVKLVGTGGSAPRDGGLFIAGLVDANVTADNISTTWGNSLITALNTLNTQIEGGGDAWVIVSRFSKSTVPTPPHKRATAVSNTVSARSMRLIVATQRDRRIGVGS